MRINDLVYSNENIEESVLIDLINSEPLQRLKGLNQYGMPDEYYHKRNFSRYDHSVGVMILLRRLGAGLEEQIAGLLHDVSHMAFSHVADWVFGNPNKEDLQDNNHYNFIENSVIRNILDRYSYDYKKIADITSFSLLEKNIPSLCADRIDYSLRELTIDNFEVKDYILNLANKNKQITFKNQEVAHQFALKFLRLNNEHWAGAQARTRYLILSNVLRKAISDGILSISDFYKTDNEVIKKLKGSSDDYIIENLDLLRNNLFVGEVVEGGVLLLKKFRYVDPEVLFNGKTKKLSEISADFYQILKEEKRKSKLEMRIIYRKIVS